MQGVVSGAVVRQGGVPHLGGPGAAPGARSCLFLHSVCQDGALQCSSEGCQGEYIPPAPWLPFATSPCPMTATVWQCRVPLSHGFYCVAVQRPHASWLAFWRCHILCPNHGTSQHLHVPTGLLPLSPWSEWTPCSTCLPLSPSHLGNVTPHVSVQHRYRACLDPQSGHPWSGDAAVCSAELQQQRLCPDPDICQGTAVPQGMEVSSSLCPPPE